MFPCYFFGKFSAERVSLYRFAFDFCDFFCKGGGGGGGGERGVQTGALLVATSMKY